MHQIKLEHAKLDKGQLAHKVWLTRNSPAKVVRVELNSRLNSEVSLERFNWLKDAESKNPGSWFVRKGFVVRSKKTKDFWIQYAYSVSGKPENLTRNEIIEYLKETTKLDYDPNIIDDSLPTIIGSICKES